MQGTWVWSLVGELRSGRLPGAAKNNNTVDKSNNTEKMCFKSETGEFPGSLLVRIPGFHYHGWGSIPGQGTEISQAKVYSQKKYTHKKGK